MKNLPINCLHSLKVVTKLSRAWGGWVYSTKNNYQAISQNVSKPPIGSVNEAYIGDKMLTQGVFTEREAYYVPEAEKKFLFNQPKYPHCLTLKKARKMRAINYIKEGWLIVHYPCLVAWHLLFQAKPLAW